MCTLYVVESINMVKIQNYFLFSLMAELVVI